MWHAQKLKDTLVKSEAALGRRGSVFEASWNDDRVIALRVPSCRTKGYEKKDEKKSIKLRVSFET